MESGRGRQIGRERREREGVRWGDKGERGKETDRGIKERERKADGETI